MSEPAPEGETLEQQKSRAQRLFARGWLTLPEYEALGRLHGFISSPKRRTIGAKALTVASVSGYALLALGALAEIIAREHPDIRGPLEALSQIAELVAGTL